MLRWRRGTLFTFSLLAVLLLLAGCAGGGNGGGDAADGESRDDGAPGDQGQVGVADPDIICEGSPTMVSTLEQLQALADNLSTTTHDQVDGYFALSNDIDASETRNWNNGAGFRPIGTENRPFTACFDGRGFTIKGLYIHRPDEDGVGLFGDAVQSDIRNVVLEDVDITGGGFTAGLVGITNATTIKNAHVSGIVRGGMQTGGLIGEVEGGEVSASSSAADVEFFGEPLEIAGNVIPFQSHGGLLGKISANVLVTRTFATGNVQGQNMVGGLIGFQESGLLTESFAFGNVRGITRVGGLVGAKQGELRDTYSLGEVMVEDGGSRAGGLVGSNGYGELTNSFSVSPVVTEGAVGGFVGGLAGEAYDSSTQFEVGARTTRICRTTRAEASALTSS